ncbi:MAG: hypothetical protein LBE86_02920, partial [Gemmobacter sp.]|nr:hypothetical protein [Gemmobacter sp.]
MKPNFALNFTNDGIRLLHRTARGWLEVGATALDVPDLGEALGYLRRSALGLAPHGVTAKLIIPNEQILYTEIDAPGPDHAHRQTQIRRALEGMTPYEVDDLVFDWSGDGPRVQVAVVARETLREAESFATQHRFNPLSFVAIPEGGQFRGEPWFGPSSLAPQLLREGETVGRDSKAVQVIGRDITPRANRAANPEPKAAPEPEAKTKAEEGTAPQVLPHEVQPPAVAPEMIPKATEPPAPPELNPAEDLPLSEPPPPFESAPPEPPPAGPSSEGWPPEALPPEPSHAEVATGMTGESSAAPPAPTEDLPGLPTEAGLAAQPDLFAPAPLVPETRVQVPAEPVATVSTASETAPLDMPRAGGDPVAGAKSAPEAEAEEQSYALDPSVPPSTPSAASRLPPARSETSPMPAAATPRRVPPAPLTPPPLGASAAVAQPYDPGRDAWGQADPDLPPAPAPAIRTARMTAQRPGGVAGPGAVARPVPAKPQGGSMTVQGIPGIGLRKAKAPKDSRQAADTLVAPPPGAAALRLDRPASRGKPRFLGLILTVVLLLALAAIAAWSSFTTARNDTAEPLAVAEAPEAATGD